MRKEIALALVSLLPWALITAHADQTMKTKPFVYHEDFEGTNDPVKVLDTAGGKYDSVLYYPEHAKYKINFQGITDEKAYSGKKSYKVDVTLPAAGASCDFEIPLGNIPVGSNLKFSGMIMVAEAYRANIAVLSLDFAYWPYKMDGYGFSGARNFGWNGKCAEWVKISADDLLHCAISVALRGPNLPGSFWPCEPDLAVPYLQRIRLSLSARDRNRWPGTNIVRKFVVYLDDLRIEGEIPDKEECQKQAERRWAPVREQTRKQIAEWEEAAAWAEGELKSLSGLSGEAARLKAELEKQFKKNDARKLPELQSAGTNGWMSAGTYYNLAPFYNNLKAYLANLKELSRSDVIQRLKGQKHIIYTVNPASRPVSLLAASAEKPANWVLPDTVLLPGRITDEIKITACPGEYKPASFVAHALVDLKSLKVQAGDLVGSAGKLPASALDIKAVKCWYQQRGLWSEGERVLTPELLLHDDNLVQTDHAKKISRIKFNLPEGPKHISADDPEWPNPEARKKHPEVWVADDSPVLLPVDIPAKENKQFWVTVHVLEDTKPGDYAGNIRLISDNKLLGEVALRLKVLPIKLAEPYCETSVFGGGDRFEKRYRNEVKNQIAHGITALAQFTGGPATNYSGQLERTLKIWKELGVPPSMLVVIDAPIVYGILVGRSHKGLTHIEITEDQKKRFHEEFSRCLNLMKSYEMREIALHMADERSGKELEAWLPVFDIVHQAGGKVVTSGGIGGGTFGLVGGITDIFLCENGISKRETDMWHSKGSKVWPIWNPSGGAEDFDLSRRNHGLLVWKCNCDGVTEYLYSLESGWIEAASEKGGARDGINNLVYLTTDGVIDTIQWEGYREGIDDIRYITTLEKAIKEAKHSGDKKKAEIASEAEKYLADVDVKYGDLDEIRAGIIEWILKLFTKDI
jgi:hypothetical protein